MWKPRWARPSQPDRKTVAERLSRALPPLLLKAEQLAKSFNPGTHGRRRAGSGEVFWQFRQYEQDDPVDKIDWRQSAKRDQVFIRQKEHETSESVWFWTDTGPDMTYASSAARHSKGDLACILTLASALLLSRAGEQFALLGQGRKPATGPVAFERFSSGLLEQSQNSLQSCVSQTNLPPRARIVLISDFLATADHLEDIITILSGQGISGTLLHLADPAEVSLPFSGRVRFEGYDHTGPDTHCTIGHVQSVRDEYMALFESHRTRIAALARQSGWDYLFHQTDEPEGRILANLYLYLQKGR
ncbi:DUF58 domain-containing protein [Sneathiella chinensis]|uniref:DUF58 domain-containing protein n=1 Tax=Sneathiella chinensis TaxID=349750 RepID=A0ABQ5U305_9PROT|nr:DUF58 domain-containing protein [Sneathiella chinensis]GLQ05727.1 hypothetical protein GCM10007924_09480 [Sneathiella chinensis]